MSAKGYVHDKPRYLHIFGRMKRILHHTMVIILLTPIVRKIHPIQFKDQ
jgi:hypothetical protein